MLKWSCHPIDRLPDWLPAWQALLKQVSDTPLLEPAFILPLLEHFGDGQERLLCCGEPSAPIALAIMSPRGRLAWETFQPSQAPLGMWLHDPKYSFAQLLPGMLRALPGFPLLAGVTQQDPALVPRPEVGGCIETLDYIRTACVPIQGTFDEYWSARGKNLRQNMKKQRNKLDKERDTRKAEPPRAAAPLLRARRPSRRRAAPSLRSRAASPTPARSRSVRSWPQRGGAGAGPRNLRARELTPGPQPLRSKYFFAYAIICPSVG